MDEQIKKIYIAMLKYSKDLEHEVSADGSLLWFYTKTTKNNNTFGDADEEGCLREIIAGLELRRTK